MKQGQAAAKLIFRIALAEDGTWLAAPRINGPCWHVKMDVQIGAISMQNPDKRFAVGFSFPGEQRSRVSCIVDILAGDLTHARVLYDKYHEAEFARPNLDLLLQRLYLEETLLNVVVLCADYERKPWCGLEWRAIRDLLNRGNQQKIMFLRADDTEVKGVFPTTDGYIDIRQHPDDEIARLILARLSQVAAGGEGAIASVSPLPSLSSDTEWGAVIEQWKRLAHLGSWMWWTAGFFTYEVGMPLTVFHDLDRLRQYFFGIIWPSAHPSLKIAFEGFALILHDWLQLFGRYSVYSGERVFLHKFYRGAPQVEPDQTAALADFEFVLHLLSDLTAELTRAANLCCDRIRATVDPKFRRSEGALLVQSIWLTERTLYRPEYRDQDRTGRAYTGLEEFLTLRETRDIHFGAGTRPSFTVWD